MRVVGYTRMSTGEAGLEGFELTEQRARLQAECERRGWELVAVEGDIQDADDDTGTDRGLKLLTAALGEDRADVLMVTRVDRLGIEVRRLFIVDWLCERDKAFVALDIGWDTTTDAGREAARVIGRLAEASLWLRVSRVTPRWDGRNAKLVEHIPPGSTVVDLGAGNQTLRTLLPEACEYQPCDIVDAPGSLRCDFNAGLWPRLTKRFDVVVVSGVLEYLYDTRGFLSRVVTLGERVLITKAPQDGKRPSGPAHPTWLPSAEFEALMTELGLPWRLLDRWQGHRIYEVAAAPRDQ